MSKILANQIANYGDNSPIEIKEGLNIPIGKPLQAAGVSGGDGQVLTSTGTTVEWTTPFDGDYDTLTNKPIIPAAQVRSDWNAIGTVAEIQNKPLIPPLPSVTVAAAGSASLEYNSTSGLFTYTPPDLSGYLTSYTETDPVFAASDAAAVTAAKISNWDAAHGWGNHASAGYLTSYTETQTLDNVLSLGATTTRDITTTGKLYYSNNFATTGDLPNATTYHGMFAHVHAEGHGYFAHAGAWTQLLDTGSELGDLANVNFATAPQTGQVLKYDGSNWVAAADGTGGGGIALSDLSVSTASAGSAALSYNNVSGVFTYTPPDLSGYLTSVAINGVSDVDINNLQDTQILRYNLTSGNWENWSPNYLTSYTETDPVFTASPANNITLTDINQWDTAYGWGNHANGGYLVATAQDKTNWNTAYGWGDHSQAGYLTSATSSDTLDDVTSRGATTTNDIQVNKVHADTILAAGPTFGTGATGTYVSVVSSGSSGYRDMLLQTTNGGGTVTLMTLTGSTSAISASGSFTAGSLTASGASPKLRINNSSNTGYAEFDYRLVGNAAYQLPALPSTNGDVLSCTTAGVMSWTTPGSTGANVTISDTAPGSPTAGDLWWESDKGRLKIYYNDTDSTQWVDASPPLQAPNSPLYVGMVQLWNYGNDITWSGSSDGVSDGLTATIRPADGGGGFQNAYVRLTFPTSFVAAEDYAVQVTVSDPSTDGHIYAPSIRKHLDRIDFYVYNLTSSVVATDWYASIAVYPL
tara:strand:- start:15414 stop:17669 length:2256 start_codon:yes stop_codon:yes gene_type:complete